MDDLRRVPLNDDIGNDSVMRDRTQNRLLQHFQNFVIKVFLCLLYSSIVDVSVNLSSNDESVSSPFLLNRYCFH